MVKPGSIMSYDQVVWCVVRIAVDIDVSSSLRERVVRLKMFVGLCVKYQVVDATFRDVAVALQSQLTLNCRMPKIPVILSTLLRSLSWNIT